MADHIFGHEHGLKNFAVMNEKVCPTKSGVTIERRDQVFTGFFTPELFILSIFSRRWCSTKGPFFNDLPINYFFFRRSRINDRSLALVASLKAFRKLAPRADRVMSSAATF